MNNYPRNDSQNSYSPQKKSLLNWYKQQRKGTQVGLASSLMLVLALCICLGGVFMEGQSSAYASPAVTTTVHTSVQASVRGVNNNPWGYTFVRGHLITRPPSRFCAYFRCISNFSKGKGYVVECKDSMYSLSGGRRGACSYHRGVWRTLYSH